MTENKKTLSKTTNMVVNPNTFHVNGLLYYYDNNNFERLPNSLSFDEGVSNLQKHSSGAYIDFTTNSSSIGVKVKLANKSYMPHMSATGTIGLDLYVLYEGKYIFMGTSKIDEKEFTYEFLRGLSKVYKDYRLYLPIYMEILELEIIIDKTAKIRQSEIKDQPKIICYGTSITQGGCATRPAMSYSSILGRLLPEYDVYNLGFSGNAHLQEEVSEVISDIPNMEILIMEVEANAGDESGMLINRLEDFVKTILDKNPNLKIYLISHYPYTMTLFKPTVKAKVLKHKVFQKEICNKYKNNMVFIDGEEILSELGYDETVDLIHLTDLGFYHLAKALEKIISKK